MIYDRLPPLAGHQAWEVPIAELGFNSHRQDEPYQLHGRNLVSLYKHYDPGNTHPGESRRDMYGRDALLRRIDDVNQGRTSVLDWSSDQALTAQVDGLNDEINDAEPIYVVTTLGYAKRQMSLPYVARLAILRGFAVEPDTPLHHRAKVRDVLEGRDGRLGTRTSASVLRQVPAG